MLAEFRSHRSLSVGDALNGITARPALILILIIPVLILTTMVTQAFSYAAIRALEGYWRRGGPMSLAKNMMIWRHHRRRNQLKAARRDAAERAFAHARPVLLGKYPYAVVAALELQAIDKKGPALDPSDDDLFRKLSWRSHCTPWHLAKVDRYADRLKDYPGRPWRTMPTTLGNVLRATEDSLMNAGDDVEGFAMRRREFASARVRLHHDQFRGRMDMYSTLVFVALILAALASGFLVERVPDWQVAVFGVAYLVFAWVCYGSAVASARGYCVALRQMDRKPQPASAFSSPSGP